MPILDRVLIFFLLGLLVYRSIDVAGLQAKLEQTMSRMKRTVDLPDRVASERGAVVGASNKTVRATFFAFRKRNRHLTEDEIRNLAAWCRSAICCSKEFHYVLMSGCVLVFLLLGLSLIATNVDQNKGMGSIILTSTATIVSSVLSVATLVLERFRLKLERVQ